MNCPKCGNQKTSVFKTEVDKKKRIRFRICVFCLHVFRSIEQYLDDKQKYDTEITFDEYKNNKNS